MSMRGAIAVVTGMCAVLLWGCGGKSPTGSEGNSGIVRPPVSPTVQGAVKDEQGHGLAGAVVEARTPGSGNVIHADTTDSRGNYRLVLQGFALGREVEVRAMKSGYRDTSRVVVLESSETVGIFLVLVRAEIVFLGRATDVLAGGAPLDGVQVTVRRSDGSPVQTAVTDAQGQYETRVDARQNQTFVLSAGHAGFAPRTDTVTVQGDTVVVDFPLSLAVVGQVKDPRGQPVASAVVTTAGGSAEGSVRVGSDGRYVLTLKQDAGGDTVVARASGFIDGRQWVPFSRTAENRADFQLVPIIDPMPQVSPQALAFGLLSDRDTLAISNAAQEGFLTWEVVEAPAWVSVTPVADSVEARRGVRQAVVALRRDLIPAGPGVAEASGSLTFAFNSVGMPSLVVPISVRLRSISGRVSDVFGQPVSGAAVSLSGAGGTASGTSDDDGRYALGAVPDGTYRLWVQAARYIASAAQVMVSGGREARRDVGLIPFPSPAEMVYEGGTPYRILIDPAGDGDRAYVVVRTTPPDNYVKVVSGLSTGSATTSRAGSDLRVGATPTDGAFYGSRLIVACYGDTSVWTVDLNTDGTERIETSPGPFGLTASGNRAYVVCEGSGGRGVLDIIDLEAKRVLHHVALGEVVASSAGDEPWGPDVSVSGARAFVTDNQEAGRVFVVDLSASPPAVVSSLNAGGRPQQIVELPSGLYSYVLNKRDPAGVTAIDRVSGGKVKTITVPDAPGYPRALALPPDPFFGRRLLYLVYERELIFYDLDLDAEVGRFRFAETGRAVSAAVTPDGRGLLVGLGGAPLGQRLLFFRFGGSD